MMWSKITSVDSVLCSPEKSSHSSPLMLSGIPWRTSSLVFSVRYIHTPCPYSVKWFFHACSFMNSFAWETCGNTLNKTLTIIRHISFFYKVWTHQFWVELLGWTPAVHGHQGLCSCGNTAVIQVKRSLALWTRTVLWTAGEHGPVDGVNLHRTQF